VLQRGLLLLLLLLLLLPRLLRATYG